jgi:hypothetical protein
MINSLYKLNNKFSLYKMKLNFINENKASKYEV